MYVSTPSYGFRELSSGRVLMLVNKFSLMARVFWRESHTDSVHLPWPTKRLR